MLIKEFNCSFEVILTSAMYNGETIWKQQLTGWWTEQRNFQLMNGVVNAFVRLWVLITIVHFRASPDFLGAICLSPSPWQNSSVWNISQAQVRIHRYLYSCSLVRFINIDKHFIFKSGFCDTSEEKSNYLNSFSSATWLALEGLLIKLTSGVHHIMLPPSQSMFWSSLKIEGNYTIHH